MGEGAGKLNRIVPAPVPSPDGGPASLPAGRLGLLVRAALAPDEEARTAWMAWRAVADLDVAPWNEVRMLGVIAGRIASLEPDAEIRPRVAGFRRKIWTHNHIRLRELQPMVARLVEAGIPLLLIKGSGRLTLDPSVAGERFVGDADALVPPDRQAEAIGLLESAGFTMGHQPWQQAAQGKGPISAHHAWSYRKGHSEVDLHHFAIPLNRLRGDDDGLWRSARRITWRGLELRVPGPEHALLIAVVHGLRVAEGDSHGDWTVDACRLLDAEPLDWDLIVAEARDRLLQAILHAGLKYLAGELRRPVPRQVLARLAADRDAELEAELGDYSTSVIATTEPAVRRGFAMAMRRFARGAALPQPTEVAQTPFVSSTVELLPEANSFWVQLAGGLPPDWFVLRVGLELPVAELRGESLLRILLPGLPVGSVRLVPPAGTGPLWRATFHVPFHGGFLAARAIDRVGVLLLRDGQPLLWPGRRTVRVDLLAARVGG
jgi:hypothetical protein